MAAAADSPQATQAMARTGDTDLSRIANASTWKTPNNNANCKPQHRSTTNHESTIRRVRILGSNQASFVFVTGLKRLVWAYMASIERYDHVVGYAYLAKVHAAGGWKRYAQAHTARLAPIFAKVFPHARLPPELVSHIVDLWAHVGYY